MGMVTSAPVDTEFDAGRVDIAKPSAVLLYPLAYCDMVNLVEQAARNCYQSELSKDFEEQCTFIKSLIKQGHESVLEHVNITMSVVIDRGILAEWTRHRVGSAYSVESTRYVNYDKRHPIILIPNGIHDHDPLFQIIMNGATQAVNAYRDAVRAGAKPEQARALLPQCLGVHMVVTHNLRQWRHVLRERLVNPRAHPDIRRAMALCFLELHDYAPVFFEDITEDVCKLDLKSILMASNTAEDLIKMFQPKSQGDE